MPAYALEWAAPFFSHSPYFHLLFADTIFTLLDNMYKHNSCSFFHCLRRSTQAPVSARCCTVPSIRPRSALMGQHPRVLAAPSPRLISFVLFSSHNAMLAHSPTHTRPRNARSRSHCCVCGCTSLPRQICIGCCCGVCACSRCLPHEHITSLPPHCTPGVWNTRNGKGNRTGAMAG